MKVGWIADYPPYTGGAEITAELFKKAAPDDVQIVQSYPEHFPLNVDCYVVHNCTEYDASHIAMLSTAPCLKYVHDLWPEGNHELRQFLLGTAELFFLSPKHVEWFDWPHREVVELCPPSIETEYFEHAVDSYSDHPREGVCWIGRYFEGKGIRQAEKWAEENETQVDFFGSGPIRPRPSEFVNDCGQLETSAVPYVMAQYDRFLFLPEEREPFGRAVAEAHLAGCDIVANGRIGALYWIQEKPDHLKHANKIFWDKVCSLTS